MHPPRSSSYPTSSNGTLSPPSTRHPFSSVAPTPSRARPGCTYECVILTGVGRRRRAQAETWLSTDSQVPRLRHLHQAFCSVSPVQSCGRWSPRPRASQVRTSWAYNTLCFHRTRVLQANTATATSSSGDNIVSLGSTYRVFPLPTIAHLVCPPLPHNSYCRHGRSRAVRSLRNRTSSAWARAVRV